MIRNRPNAVLDRFALTVTCLAAASAVGVSAVSAHVIDNFEQGTFDVLAPAGASASGSQFALNPFNCIAGKREVTVTSHSASQPASAGLSLSPQDDEVASVMPDEGGIVSLVYDIGADTDITVGGTRDRIRLSLSVAPDGGGADVGEVRLSLSDDTGAHQSVSLPFGGPGNVDFWLSDYPSVNLVNVQRVDVDLIAYRAGDYHVRDIRTVKLGTPLVYIPVGSTEVSGPGYPTEPLLWEGIADPEGETAPGGALALKISDAQVDPSIPCDDFCDGVPYGLFTLPAEVPGHSEAWVRFEGGFNDVFPAEQTLSFQLSFEPPADHTYGEPIWNSVWVNGGFMVEMSMELFDGSGTSLGMTEHHVMGDLMNDLSPVLSDFVPSVVSGNDLHLVLGLTQVTGRVRGTGDSTSRSSEDAGTAVLALRVESTASAEVVLDVPGAAAVMPQLTARPTVMRTQTTFDLAGTADVARSLDIYDVAGRSVRSLSVPAGSTLARWDGRTTGGIRVSPGVYIARVAGARGGAGARLVVVR